MTPTQRKSPYTRSGCSPSVSVSEMEFKDLEPREDKRLLRLVSNPLLAAYESAEQLDIIYAPL